jgi:hypothetical protein
METETEKKETVIADDAITNSKVNRIIVSLSEIGNLEIEDFDLNYGITRTLANLNQVEKAYLKSLTAIQKKCIKKDEKGNLAVENGFFVFNNTEDKETYGKETEELNEKVVDVKVWRMKTSQLKKIKGIKGTAMAKCNELIDDDLNIK